MTPDRLGDLVADITTCRRCQRLVAWREDVARTKVPRYRDSVYWGRPVPGFGDPRARLLVVGLAPAAHGGNRSGRVFTGDSRGVSGELLFAALHRTGYSPRPRSVSAGDGLRLDDCYIAAVNRCAPPANKPTSAERDNCLPFLERELRLLPSVRVILALGGYAWDAIIRVLARAGHRVTPKPRFRHAAEVTIGPYEMLGCYHPSQQNTFTGRLTPSMVDDVLVRARALSGTRGR
ncbi:MAG: uracil-DNA glycosylase [Chloroflexota bacterium]|jgi:uracil-DNA glycosylase family 4